MKKNFYVVWEGHNPGVYDNWEDAQDQINGYSGAKFKGFQTSEEAVEAYRAYIGNNEARELSALVAGAAEHRKNRVQSPDSSFSQPEFGKPRKPSGAAQTDYFQFPEIDLKGWAVDASCMGNPGRMEYRCVELMSGREIFHMGPFEKGTNNIGEFLAIVHALALMYKNNDWHTLYSDSRTAMGWVWKRTPKTTLKADDSNRKLFELLGRAVLWLRGHDWPVNILKWETEKWGEIPADFDRK